MKRIVGITAALVMAGAGVAADWPAFRGSQGGVASDGEVPVKTDSDNFVWKTKLPGPGSSSPITYGDKIFVTAYSGYGTKLSAGGKGGFAKGGGFQKGGFPKGGGGGPDEGGDQAKLRLHVICLGREKGDILWDKQVEPKLPEASFSGFIRDHGYATSTPATDGERVYAFFGKSGVVAFSLAGEKIWHKTVGSQTNSWGSGASPAVFENLVIVPAAIESGAIVALDGKTGEEKWRVKGVGNSWSSPIIAETKEGKHELVMSQPGKVVGYDPKTGTELWRCQGIGSGGGGGGGFGGGKGGYTSSSPVAKNGVVYVSGGGGPNPQVTLAIKTGGKGNVDSTHVLWKKSMGTGIASPVLVGDRLCWVAGRVTALDVKDGGVADQERLYEGGQEYVSPVAAGDKVYALTRGSGLYVLDGKSLKEVAHVDFKGDSTRFNASPAVSDGRLYVRSNEAIYCIGKK